MKTRFSFAAVFIVSGPGLGACAFVHLAACTGHPAYWLAAAAYGGGAAAGLWVLGVGVWRGRRSKSSI